MDWGTIAALISALATVIGTWIAYLEYQHNRNTAQPPSDQGSTPASGLREFQPRRGGFLSSKVGRRSVLLGSTAIGLVLIVSGVVTEEIQRFYIGNSIILVCGMCVWRARAQGIAVWRRAVLKYGGAIGGFNIMAFLVWFAWGGEGMVDVGYWLGLSYVWFFSLIIYLVSLYIGRW